MDDRNVEYSKEIFLKDTQNGILLKHRQIYICWIYKNIFQGPSESKTEFFRIFQGLYVLNMSFFKEYFLKDYLSHKHIYHSFEI